MDVEKMSKEPQFKDIPRPTLQSIFSTNEIIKSLAVDGLQKKEVLFVPDTLSIENDGAGAMLLSDDQGSAFRTFVRTAQDLASTNACASVLAGQGSEGDEYGDVGLQLGADAGKAIDEAKDALGRAKAVLAALNMEHVLAQASDPSTLVSSSTFHL